MFIDGALIDDNHKLALTHYDFAQRPLPIDEVREAELLALFPMLERRLDTPQQYGDVLVERCTGTVSSSAIEASTWTQFHNKIEREDLPPSVVSNVTIRDIDIKAGSFFKIEKKHDFTVRRFTLENIQATDRHNRFDEGKVTDITIKNVTLNNVKK